MSVKLTVVGCSPAWPNPGGAQSGYLVEGGERLLLDCGPGVLARLRAVEQWPRVDAILVTHWHLDHWGDLVPWVWGVIVGPGRDDDRPELWLPPDGVAQIRDFGTRLGWEDMFESVFELREYADDEPFEVGRLRVTPVELPHYSHATFGVRVTDGRATVAYSGDTGPSDRLAELASGADLFVCEATLERAEYDGALRGHLSADEAVEAFEASGAHRLLITHRPSELPLDDGLEEAYDGMEIEL